MNKGTENTAAGTGTVTVRVRSSNFELMRIFLMLGIILHHYVVNSGVTSLYDYNHVSASMIFCQIFGTYGKTIINCFTLITGYFMVRSDISLKKFLRVYLEYKFYYIFFFLVLCAAGYESFSLNGILKTLFSIVYEFDRRYSGTYIVFFLFIPFINVLVKGLDQRKYQLLLALCLGVFTVAPTLFDNFFGFSTYDFLGWMIVTYLIGGYIALYPCRWFESFSLAAVLLALQFALVSAAFLIIDYRGSFLGLSSAGYLTSNCNKILAIGIAVSVFLLFKNLKIRNSRWINTIAASTFGILLIHTNCDGMRTFLWGTVWHVTDHFKMGLRHFLPYTILAVLGTYIVCFFIDYLRIQLLEKPLFRFLDGMKEKKEGKNGTEKGKIV